MSGGGCDIKGSVLANLFSVDQVKNVKYINTKQEDLMSISGQDIYFCVGNSKGYRLLKAKQMKVAFPEKSYKFKNNFVVIDSNSLDLDVQCIQHNIDVQKCKQYGAVEKVNLSKSSILIHKNYVKRIEFAAPICRKHMIGPTREIILYLGGSADHSLTSKFLKEMVPDHVEVSLSVDFGFIKDMDKSLKIFKEVLQRKVVKIDFLIEVYYELRLDIYELVSNCKTIQECSIILHQDISNELELVN